MQYSTTRLPTVQVSGWEVCSTARQDFLQCRCQVGRCAVQHDKTSYSAGVRLGGVEHSEVQHEKSAFRARVTLGGLSQDVTS